MKVCNHCGTSENLIIDKRGVVYAICKNCKTRIMKEATTGSKNHNFGKRWAKEKIVEEKKCIHCGTSNGLIHDSLGRIWNVCRKCRSEQTIIKNTGKIMPEITKNKIGNANRGRIPDNVTRKKMSESHKGVPLSLERRLKLIENNTGRKHYEITKDHLSKLKTLKADHYRKKYPLFCLEEQIRDAPYEKGKAGIQVTCKKCNEWFTPTYQMIANRILSIDKNKNNHHFYCSDDCKNSCSLFGFRIDRFLNNLNRPDTDPIHNSPEYTTFRNEVLARQRKEESDSCYNHCEICNSESNLHVHHEHPVKTHPHLALDPDNGIILCSSCHYTIGHQDNCSTSSLANKICVPININNEII